MAKAATPRINWTRRDELAAIRQGWTLFTVDSGGIVIQKLDDPPAHHLWDESMPETCRFESDGQAIRFVRKQARAERARSGQGRARSGERTARKAIAIHDRHIRAWNDWRRQNGYTTPRKRKGSKAA